MRLTLLVFLCIAVQARAEFRLRCECMLDQSNQVVIGHAESALFTPEDSARDCIKKAPEDLRKVIDAKWRSNPEMLQRVDKRQFDCRLWVGDYPVGYSALAPLEGPLSEWIKLRLAEMHVSQTENYEEMLAQNAADARRRQERKEERDYQHSWRGRASKWARDLVPSGFYMGFGY